MSSVNSQNNVRLRVFLILVLSIGVRFARSFASDSVHKATGILEVNYVLYGITLICTLLPLKTAWIIAIGSVGLSSALGIFSCSLAIISTIRCMSGTQTGCMQYSAANIITVSLAGIITVLDLMQVWSVYLILRFPAFVASATQRIRILFSWAWPFAWLINISLAVESQWTFFAIPHIFIDPTIIVLATIDESYILLALMCAAAVCDAISLLFVSLHLARLGLWVSLSLTLAGIIMIFASNTPDKKVTPPVAQETTPIVQATPVKNMKSVNLTKRRKSQPGKISF